MALAAAIAQTKATHYCNFFLCVDMAALSLGPPSAPSSPPPPSVPALLL